MPGISQKKFHLTIQGPAAEALDALHPYATEILTRWRSELSAFDPGAAAILSNVPVDFQRLSQGLRASTYSTLGVEVRGLRQKLAKEGVRVEQTASALDRLFEICVHFLMQKAEVRASTILAFARLYSLMLLFLIAEDRADAGAVQPSRRARVSARDEDRDKGATAYVTRIYEQERDRLSRDLHDEVGHDLIVLKLNLELIALEAQQREMDGIHNRLNQAVALVGHAIESVRRLVHDLGPAVFDDLGFIPAVRTYVNQFSARTNIPLTLREGYLPKEIPMSHQVALYRLLQGALSNVLKHASAKTVKVSLGCMKDSMMIMVIQDDGVGFDVNAKPARSFGLNAMRERIEVLGGRIHIQSNPAGPPNRPRGTRIEVDLPLPGGAK